MTLDRPLVRSTSRYYVRLRAEVRTTVVADVEVDEDAVREWAELDEDDEVTQELIHEYVCDSEDLWPCWELIGDIDEWDGTDIVSLRRERVSIAPASFAGDGGRTVTPILFHGGVPDLRAGDLVLPTFERRHHPGCPWCEARARGGAFDGQDGPTPEGWVYASTSRLYAKHYASLYGRGDLYRVEPVDGRPVERSTEDSIETYRAPAFRVAAVLDRVVLLTHSERRRLAREWAAADAAVGWAS